MKFVDYRKDPLPLLETVLERMKKLDVQPKDQDAIFTMLGPLGEKGEAGQFHRDHCLRVGLLASEIGECLGEDPRALLFAGLMHDVGKALVSGCTLGATEAWTAENQAEMEAHVIDGFRMLRDRFDFTAHVIVCHHQFQARKYPTTLPAALQEFSPETMIKALRCGRLLAIADVYDALHRINVASGGRELTREEVRKRLYAPAAIMERLYRSGVLT